MLLDTAPVEVVEGCRGRRSSVDRRDGRTSGTGQGFFVGGGSEVRWPFESLSIGTEIVTISNYHFEK